MHRIGASIMPARPRPGLRGRGRTIMDVILHIGAHRTASTTFQAYLRHQGAALAQAQVGYIGPARTRGGLFAGIWPDPALPAPKPVQVTRAAGRIALTLDRMERAGIRQLIVSDENILGLPRATIRAGTIYPQVGGRLSALLAAFGGRISAIALSIRCPSVWWPSLIAMTVARGHPLPDAAHLARIAGQARRWQDVIAALAQAAPGVPLLVLPHETYGAVPERRLARMLAPGTLIPPDRARSRLNISPDLAQLRAALAQAGRDPLALPAGDGPYRPFSAAQAAALRESYADDLFWLRAGADGLARLITEKTPDKGGTDPSGPIARGQHHEHQGRVAQAG